MYKKYLIRSRAVAIACVLAFTTMACGTATGSNTSTSAVSAEASSQETASQKSESDTLQSTMSKGTFGNSSNDTDKEETVYVAGDATGAQDKVTVSDWLKNEDGSKTIKDETSLQDVTNVKGNEDFVKNSDGTITWNADGNDIYYQGTSSQQLPVNVKVSYKLDGKDIKPEDLAGKSGKVTIRFDYTNNDKKTVDINGKSEEIYTPFAMVSGVMLPTDKFSNVQVSNGKVISDANDYIVMGVGLPGLKDSLKLDEDKLEDIELTDKNVNIPDYVEITADTNDFQLGMTMTMASSDALSDLGFTDLDNSDKVDDVNSKINDMTDGVQQLQDGSKSLQTGTGKLYDGTKKLTNGTYKLVDGASKLTDGATTLKDGSGKLNTGAGDLQKGISDYTGGVAKVADGATQLDNGVSSLQSGVGTLQSGAGTLADGINSAYSGSTTLKNGTATALTGAGTLKDGTVALQAGVNTLVSKMSTSYYAADIAYKTLYAMYHTSGLTSSRSVSRMSLRANVVSTPKVTLVLNGGSYSDEAASEVNVTTITDDDGNKTYQLDNAPETPTYDGYSFTGWYTSSDCTGDAITFPYTLTSSTTLYAGWSENSTDKTDDSEVKSAVTNNDTADKTEDTAGKTDGSTTTTTPTTSGDATTKTGTTSSGDATGSSNTTTTITDSTIPASGSPSSGNTDTGTTENNTSTVTDSKVSEQSRSNVITSNIVLFDGTDTSDITITESEYTSLANVIGGYKSTYGTMSDYLTYIDSLKGTSAKNSISAILEAMTGIDLDTWVTTASTITDTTSTATAKTKAATQMATVESALNLQKSKIDLTSLNKLNAGAASAAGGAAQLYTGLGQLDAGAGTLNSGLSQLASGGASLVSGTQTLSDGVSSLKSGSSQLVGGINTLNSNSAKLNSGAADLATGMVTLDNGVSDLLNGTVTLGNGVGTLSSGAKSVQNGAKKLNTGAGDLTDGIAKFNDEGVSKISEAFDGDIQSFSDRLQAVNKASEDYTSFGGAASDQKSTVKFFFKTAGITTDEDSSNS